MDKEKHFPGHANLPIGSYTSHRQGDVSRDSREGDGEGEGEKEEANQEIGVPRGESMLDRGPCRSPPLDGCAGSSLPPIFLSDHPAPSTIEISSPVALCKNALGKRPGKWHRMELTACVSEAPRYNEF